MSFANGSKRFAITAEKRKSFHGCASCMLAVGDWKSIRGIVSEMRIDCGPGYRLYFMRRGRIVIIMLAGGDKTSQRSDIDKATRIAMELEAQS